MRHWFANGLLYIIQCLQGMMDVEYNRFSVIPLVLQMREGADAVDLGILQKRVSKYPPPKPFGLTSDLPLIDVSSP